MRSVEEDKLWAKLSRAPSGALPITLNQRRGYIVPSGCGVFFALMMFAVLGGALNYNNNGALLFGLLPVSLGVVSMLQTFRNLDRLM